MGLNSKTIQRISNGSASGFAHSSGLAGMQPSSGAESSSYASFSARQSIDQNRKMIQGYRNSQLARGVNHMPHARTFRKDTEDSQKIGAIGSSLGKNADNNSTKPHGTAHYADSIKPNFKVEF